MFSPLLSYVTPDIGNPFWQRVVFWLWGVVAVSGALAVSGSLISAVIQYRISSISEKAARTDIDEARLRIRLAEAREREASARIAEADAKAALAVRGAEEAKARAAEAELQIAKMRTPRSLTPEIHARLFEAAARFPSSCVSLAAPAGDREALAYGTQIENALIEAGWVASGWVGAGGIVINREGKPDAGLFSGAGAGFAIHANSSTQLFEAAKALSEALLGPGGEPNVLDEKVIGPGEQCLRILVGNKRMD